MKKRFSISKALLTISLMLTTCLSTLAHNFEVDGIYYKIISQTDKTACVTYQGTEYYYFENEYSGDIVIPSTVSVEDITFSVIGIDAYTFYNCTGVTSISIPKTITKIGDFAFYNTAWFNSQPDGVLYLDDCCVGCKGFAPTGALTIKDGTRLIINRGFYKFADITELTIPNSVETIGDYAFYECKGLKSADLGNSVAYLGDAAFSYCENLSSISIPNSVTKIGYYAFSGCLGLKDVSIGNSVIEIDEQAFQDCKSLANITIPNSVTTIGVSAFNGCSNLESVTIGNSVTDIGSWTFYNCSKLKSIDIPN